MNYLLDLGEQISEVVARLDTWFDSMRSTEGYGGPVTHWWQDSLAYTGPGLDWRYEGIITGYLNLYRNTGHDHWLSKARRAGDDLVRGQLASANYRNSSFEINPLTGGTPHEAACDLALLRLALVLKEDQDPDWQRYAQTAEKNLQKFILGILWDDKARQLRNTAYDETFVPNKAATTVEALFAWSAVSGEEDLIERCAVPTLNAILAAQVNQPSSPMNGAIYQGLNGRQANERFFPYYIARCIPALVQGHEILAEPRYLDAACNAMAFILRYRLPDGSFPQVIYGSGRFNRYPQWIAAVGDILRAMTLLNRCRAAIDIQPTLTWLLQGRQDSGSIRTAFGFASMRSQRPPASLPDFRDVLGVSGWCDKAFHYLTTCVPAGFKPLAGNSTAKMALPCRCAQKPAIYREDSRQVEIRRGRETLYRWQKGTDWPDVMLN
jgi:hypothetical protein